VDVYDAITTQRPYKLARPAEDAYAELEKEAGRGWRDRALVDEFVTAARAGEFVAPPDVPPARS
jgi:putative two-component system response regulator